MLLGGAVLVMMSFAFDLVWLLQVDPPVFIGHADQANAADMARSIADGMGPVVHNHWLYTAGGLDAGALPHPEPYWPTYPSYVMSIFFAVLGPGRWAVIASASVMKLVAGLASGLLVLRLTRDRTWAGLATLIVLFDPSMLRRVNGLSDIYFASAVVVFVWSIIATRERPGLTAITAGGAAGAAIGFRPPLGAVVLVPVLMLLGQAVHRRDREESRRWAGVLGVTGVVLVPMVWHNVRSFSTVLPPGHRLATYAAAARESGAGHNAAFYDPTYPVVPYELIDPDRFIDGLVALASATIGGRVWSFFLIFVVVVVAAASIRRSLRGCDPSAEPAWADRSAELRRTLVVTAWFAVVALGLPAVIAVEARFWTFLLPLTAVLVGVAGSRASSRPSGLPRRLLAGTVAVTLVAGAFAWFSAEEPGTTVVPELQHSRPVSLPIAYIEARELLPHDAVVMNNNPWQFAYHTRRPAVMVPYTDDHQVVIEWARRYRVTHLVVIGDELRHPEHRGWRTAPPGFLEPQHLSERLFIARFRG